MARSPDQSAACWAVSSTWCGARDAQAETRSSERELDSLLARQDRSGRASHSAVIEQGVRCTPYSSPRADPASALPQTQSTRVWLDAQAIVHLTRSAMTQCSSRLSRPASAASYATRRPAARPPVRRRAASARFAATAFYRDLAFRPPTVAYDRSQPPYSASSRPAAISAPSHLTCLASPRA